MTSDAGHSLLVGRLHPDPELARQAGFALFALTHLETTGLLPPLVTAGRVVPPAALPGAVQAVLAANPHLLASFRAAARRDALAALDPGASTELVGWLRSQRLEHEEPQVAYELAMLALGLELPPILVRGLREIELRPDSLVAELPDGGGYPTVFLSTLHPHWRAAGCARLFVYGADAEQLAGWAMLLLSRTLAPPPGSIRPVSPETPRPFSDQEHAVALEYNPVPWLPPGDGGDTIRAAEIVRL